MELERANLRLVCDWLGAGHEVATATLVDAAGSSPFDIGAQMLVRDDGMIEGSVTGGCVEADLVEHAQSVIGGETPRLVSYGITEELATGVGLMCGGTVHVFVNKIHPGSHKLFELAVDATATGREVAIVTLLSDEHPGKTMVLSDGTLSGGSDLAPGIRRAVEYLARGCLAGGTSALRGFGRDGQIMGDELRCFVQAFTRPPSLTIFGAVDISAAMARLAKPLGYSVTICDAREPFTTASRFEAADEVVVDWPDRFLAGREIGPRDAVLVFTHDPKFDEPALRAALTTGAGYIGALGSRRTVADRNERLVAAGVTEEELDRIAAPCGLDIGGRTPEETALSILAEIIARASGRAGERLSATSGAIHTSRGR